MALPFTAFLLGSSLDGLWRSRGAGRIAAAVAALACIVPSALAHAGIYAIPHSARAAFDYRWNTPHYHDPDAQWQLAVENAQRWTKLGKALAEHTAPGESLVLGTIGAVGFHSDLHIYDTFGLVNRLGHELEVRRQRRSPGHDRPIPLDHFLRLDPHYVAADLVPRQQPQLRMLPQLRPDYRHAESVEVRFIPLTNDKRLLRLAVWKGQ